MTPPENLAVNVLKDTISKVEFASNLEISALNGNPMVLALSALMVTDPSMVGAKNVKSVLLDMSTVPKVALP